jgi:hypothetical protein
LLDKDIAILERLVIHVGGTVNFDTRDYPKMAGVYSGKICVSYVGITVTIYRLEVEFTVFLSLVAELSLYSSHSAPSVTNPNDCFTDKQLSINFTKLYLNHLLVAANVSYKGMSYTVSVKSLGNNMKLSLQ